MPININIMKAEVPECVHADGGGHVGGRHGVNYEWPLSLADAPFDRMVDDRWRLVAGLNTARKK